MKLVFCLFILASSFAYSQSSTCSAKLSWSMQGDVAKGKITVTNNNKKGVYDPYVVVSFKMSGGATIDECNKLLKMKIAPGKSKTTAMMNFGKVHSKLIKTATVEIITVQVDK